MAKELGKRTSTPLKYSDYFYCKFSKASYFIRILRESIMAMKNKVLNVAAMTSLVTIITVF
jgi:hypothetical protein